MLFKVNLYYKNKSKWSFYNKIYYLRKHGTYNTFYYSLEKSLNNNFYFLGITINILNNNYRNFISKLKNNYIFNYFDNFYKVSKNLRYHFKIIFLKKSKKHTKIRSFIVSKKIKSHPSIMNINKLFINYYPGYIIYRNIFLILNSWISFNEFFYNNIFSFYKKINKKNNFLYIWKWSVFFNLKFYEEDLSSGFYLNLRYFNNNNNNNSFWSILIKFLYWRLYSM